MWLDARSEACGHVDGLNDACGLRTELGSSNSERLYPFRSQKTIPLFIPRHAKLMLRAVDLDRELRGGNIEIQEVRPNGELAPNLESDGTTLEATP